MGGDRGGAARIRVRAVVLARVVGGVVETGGVLGDRSNRERLEHRVNRLFRGGLVFKAHRWLYHSTLGSRVGEDRVARLPWGVRLPDYRPTHTHTHTHTAGELERLERGQHGVARLFRGGLVFKAHRLLYHSTLGSRVIKKKRR